MSSAQAIEFNPLHFFRIVFGLFLVMNLVLWLKGSSGAVPFVTLVDLLTLWFSVSVPLTLAGAYFGSRKRVSERNNCVPFSHLIMTTCS